MPGQWVAGLRGSTNGSYKPLEYFSAVDGTYRYYLKYGLNMEDWWFGERYYINRES
jgi:hypothetical protein